MVTDERRREVAARIRELMDECPIIPFFMVIAQAINKCLPEEEGAYALIVADLIDRPTCRMEPEGEGFRCSFCGRFHDLSGFEEFPWPYCPECGAMVVRTSD